MEGNPQESSNQEKLAKAKRAFESYQDDFALTEAELKKPLLDVGANKGDFVRYVREVIGNDAAYGIDKNRYSVDPSQPGMLVGDGLALPYPDGTFDTVIASNYLPIFNGDPERLTQAIDELIRMAAPGGKVIANIFTPEWEEETIFKLESDRNSEGSKGRSLARLEQRRLGAMHLMNLIEGMKRNGQDVEVRTAKHNRKILVIHKPK